MSRQFRAEKYNATGSAAISKSVAVTNLTRVASVTLHLSAAPTTSEDFEITLNANAGAVYDTLLYSLDLSSGSTADLVWYPDEDFLLETGDAIDITFANSDTRTYGLQVTTEELI